MIKQLFAACFVLMSIVAAVKAVPAGYISEPVILSDPPTTQSGVFSVDSMGRLYFGHATTDDSLRDPRTGRGASSEIWIWDSVNGGYSQFYDSPGTNPSINSVAGIWIDEGTSPWTYFIADQQPDPANPWTTGAVWIAQDLTGDGDIMDGGDRLDLLTVDTSVLVYISDIIRDDITGEIYVTNAEGLMGNPMVYRLFDADSSGFIEASEMTAYYLLANNSAYAGGLTFGEGLDEIYTHESTGSVYRLRDLNDDGDALDSNEAILFASLPIAGAFDIESDPDGDLFVTASDWSTYTHAIYEITTSGSPVVTVFDDLTSAVGSMGGIAFGPGLHFEPAPVTQGARLYLNYTTSSWTDPGQIGCYYGQPTGPVETPTMGTWGIVLLIAGIGTMLIRRS
ncbi:hypothetical protein JXA80_11470 [bacterium]|nr:hypothetical protein [candidate division CSSED10-310 bacterium]